MMLQNKRYLKAIFIILVSLIAVKWRKYWRNENHKSSTALVINEMLIEEASSKSK